MRSKKEQQPHNSLQSLLKSFPAIDDLDSITRAVTTFIQLNQWAAIAAAPVALIVFILTASLINIDLLSWFLAADVLFVNVRRRVDDADFTQII